LRADIHRCFEKTQSRRSEGMLASPMLEWALISMVLLVVSTVYCARNMIADFRNAKASFRT
jgi:hypothetical protein